MIFEFTDYRGFLKAALAERVAKNASYSLRAMAKQIGLSPATVSEVIQGKKRLSYESGTKIAKWMKFSVSESEYFTTLIQLDLAKSAELKYSLLEKLQSLNPNKDKVDLSFEVFRVISDWYHIPIMEMTFLKDFTYTAQCIAKVLEISKAEADAALDRLECLELIEKAAKGRYRKCQDNLLIRSEKPSAALRSFHKQMLEKAIESLQTQTSQEKFVGSETFAFDTHRLNQVNEVIEECLDKILAIAKRSKNKDSVYHLGVQFFNLTKEGGSR